MSKKLYCVTIEPEDLWIVTSGGYEKALQIALKHFPEPPQHGEEITIEIMANPDRLIVEEQM